MYVRFAVLRAGIENCHHGTDNRFYIFFMHICIWMYIHTLLVGSGVFVGLLGVAYYGKIHNITYFILVQIGVGVFEVSVGTYQF